MRSTRTIVAVPVLSCLVRLSWSFTTSPAVTTSLSLQSYRPLTGTDERRPAYGRSLFLPAGLRLSSSGSSETDEADELAKLRKKRAEILTKRKAPGSTTDVVVSSSSQASSISPPKRPSVLQHRVAAKEAARAQEEAASSNNKASGGDPALAKKNDVSTPGIDHLADYEDENELHIPNRIGFGTMSWGDASRGFVSKKKLKKKDAAAGKFVTSDLREAYDTLLCGGVRFVDTSESYGTAEKLLGRFAERYTASGDTPLLTSGYADPYRLFVTTQGQSGVRVGAGSVVTALERSCQRLETSNLELYQLKTGMGSNPLSSLLYLGGRGALADGLVRALDRGSCNHVGVACNVYKPRTLKTLQRALEKRQSSLSTNSFAFSLTNRKALRQGTIEACKELGIVPLAHTPLGGGLASGRYTANNPTGGRRGPPRYSFKKVLEPLLPLHDAQLRVATKVKERLRREFREERDRRSRKYMDAQNSANENREVTPMQVAINYVVAKGAVPIPGIKNKAEAEELLGCLGWGLTEEEVAMLDQAADACGR